MIRSFLLLATALSLAFAPVPMPKPKPDPSKQDLKRMQGRWVLVSEVCEGRVQPLRPLVATIKKNHLTWESDSGAGPPWQIALDANKKPKALDAMLSVPRRSVRRFVYVMDRDTLMIAFNYKGGRPASLATADERFVFKRSKPKGAR